MIFNRQNKLTVGENEIAIKRVGDEDYLCITDMMKSKDGEFFVTDWLRNKDTIEFLGVWESMHNPNFNYGEFATIKNTAGVRRFKISVKEWSSRTNAIGLVSSPGRYGGTYAHRDIAFEFGTWISPTFKLYLIKEYQRLKDIESNTYNLEWDVRRMISKSNYTVHTDAVKDYLLPSLGWNKKFAYADEADLLNIVIFGKTAKQWREEHASEAKNSMNVRDIASINELVILSNLESYNAELLSQKISKQERFELLKKMAERQVQSLHVIDPIKSLKRLSDTTYLDANEKDNK